MLKTSIIVKILDINISIMSQNVSLIKYNDFYKRCNEKLIINYIKIANKHFMRWYCCDCVLQTYIQQLLSSIKKLTD